MRYYTEKNIENYKSMEKLSLVAFCAELPNLLLTAASAFASNTAVVWVDTINSLGETLHCFIVYLVTRTIRKENGDKYNFGVDRLEVFSSFICDALVILGLLAVLTGAIYGIIAPSYPADSLLFFVIIKCSNIAWDLVFLIKSIKASKKEDSRLFDSEVKNYTKALSFDVIIGIIVFATYFFRKERWICYVNPAVSIILIGYFLNLYIRRIKDAIGELSDKSLSIANQDEVYDIVMSYPEIIKKIEEVNCRKLNNKTYIDVCLVMHDNVTYEEQRKYLAAIREKILDMIPDCIVRLVIGQDTFESD